MKRDERRLFKVLFTVVREYIKSKRPVSSRKVLEVTELDWSSATIRNDLKKLEEMGYVYQPHTSAGRIPTDKGLRFYFDEMMKIRRKGEGVGVDVSQRFPIGDLDTILEGLARILSASSKGVAVVLKPSLEKLKLLKVHVTPIGENHAVVSIITELGLSKVIPIPSMDSSKATMLERLFSSLQGLSLGKLMEMVKSYRAEREEYGEIVELLKGIVGFALSGKRLIYSGLYEIMESSNQGIEKIVKVLEEPTKLESFLENVKDAGVFIGSENPLDELSDFAFFVAPYRKERDIVGYVGLITDKFVPYERIFPLVEFIANRLTEYLTVASRG